MPGADRDQIPQPTEFELSRHIRGVFNEATDRQVQEFTESVSFDRRLYAHDIDASIAWYERYTPLKLLDRRQDADGYGAWLAHDDQVDRPFVLVLVSFFRDQGKGPQPTMAPFAQNLARLELLAVTVTRPA